MDEVSLDHWDLKIVRKAHKWSKYGYPGIVQRVFVDGYRISEHHRNTHVDKYFLGFLREYLQCDNIPEKFNKWRFGYATVSSVFKNIVRYREPITPPHPRKWRIAQEFCQRHFSFMNNSRLNWDFDESKLYVNGSKSPGFPYNRPYSGHPGFAKKRDYLAYQGGEYARRNYEAYLERLSTSCENYQPTSFCLATGKSELREISKIEADKFRAYTATNIDNTLAGISAMGDMNEKFYNSWWFSSSFVGGSFFSGAWHKLFTRLEKHPNAFEMDVSSWDATLSKEMIESFGEVMWSFVHIQHKNNVNHTRFRNLFKEIWQTLVLCPDGSLFLKNQGNPSGSFLTIVTNTMIHYMLFAYAWVVLNPKGESTCYEDFDNAVSLALCGDDSLGTVDDVSFPWFNTKTIANVWKTLGIQVKDSAVGEGPLVERHFLSQRTRLVSGRYLPFPDYEKAVSTMIWKTKAHLGIRWSYLKACAMRIYTFNDLETNKLFAAYINFLENDPKLSKMLKAPPTGQDLTWDIVRGVYKTDRQIQWMYMPLTESQQYEIGAQAGLKVANELWQESAEEGEEECEAGPQGCCRLF